MTISVESMKNNRHYDYVIAGGGLAGLSLAYAMVHTPVLKDKKIIIIDRQPKQQNDRTWSFWTRQSTRFDHIIYKTWKKIDFFSNYLQKRFELVHYRYATIRGIDFYREVYHKLNQCSNVHFAFGEIIDIGQREEIAYARTHSDIFYGTYLFNSLFQPELYDPYQKGYHYIRQHFKGYLIHTPEPFFDSSAVTMFDFRTEQKDGVYFFYILPYREDCALVEYTGFSRELLDEQVYDAQLQKYIRSQLQLTDYQIKETEFASIPMTDYPFCTRQGRIVYIGVQGGGSKPSTGYAFMRIQKQVEKIVKNLQTKGTPFYKPDFRPQFGFYDAMLLNIMHREGWKVEKIFSEMFRKNPIERIFRFLDEESSIVEDFLIMASVPPLPFLESIVNLLVGRKPIKRYRN
ncbi:MAG: lycopene cyclase family protein [Cytophagales bacterium]|nr:lycopene cyclase family protein [Bernardetiaceae bacterium]MDW8211595.1 lycopene cyclase family protein [Cytophagales bacterium]